MGDRECYMNIYIRSVSMGAQMNIPSWTVNVSPELMISNSIVEHAHTEEELELPLSHI